MFPNDWPDGCPPLDSVDADKQVFRVVANDPIEHSDFLSAGALGRHSNSCPCQRVGLSVFDSLSGAQHCMKLFPRLGSRIAEATLSAGEGKLKASGRQGHLTWWPSLEAQFLSLFRIVP